MNSGGLAMMSSAQQTPNLSEHPPQRQESYSMLTAGAGQMANGVGPGKGKFLPY